MENENVSVKKKTQRLTKYFPGRRLIKLITEFLYKLNKDRFLILQKKIYNKNKFKQKFVKLTVQFTT